MKNDGGNAFPAEVGDADAKWTIPGMPLRDYFAAKAMVMAGVGLSVADALSIVGLAVGFWHWNGWLIGIGLVWMILSTVCSEGVIVKGAYRYADAMLKEREDGRD